jgi:hypothetical protein
MEEKKNAMPLYILAKVISVIFHPLFMPLYGMIIIFTAPTLFSYIPFNVKKILLFVIATNNILVPLSLMPFFRYRNIIRSWNIETRKERIIPLLSVSFFYSVTSYIIFRLQIPLFIKSFIFATALLAIAVSIINFWWKISLHSVGAGALAGLVIALSVNMMIPLTWFLIPVLIIAGLILSSRLRLETHNPPEVYIGFITGFIMITLLMVLF